MAQMTHDEYCIRVCKGKCCKIWSEDEPPKELFRCPNQLENGACGIFDQWKDRGTCGFVPETGVTKIQTGDILEMLPGLPEFVQDQCCYKHPELLGG